MAPGLLCLGLDTPVLRFILVTLGSRILANCAATISFSSNFTGAASFASPRTQQSSASPAPSSRRRCSHRIAMGGTLIGISTKRPRGAQTPGECVPASSGEFRRVPAASVSDSFGMMKLLREFLRGHFAQNPTWHGAVVLSAWQKLTNKWDREQMHLNALIKKV